jgi:spermidine dehydrogenase
VTQLKNISRRDFLQGSALSLAAGCSLAPAELLAMAAGADVYPPLQSGMRGNHPGSFEVAHALAWAGQSFPRPAKQQDDDYDLIVVGGGISGLSAAFLYRQQAGPGARILVLDNHDDYGGHAKRNEFIVDGKKLIGYGGSQSIDGPGHYSPAAKQLLVDVGIDTRRFYDYFDQDWYAKHELQRGIYFDRETYGRNVLLPHVLRIFGGDEPDNLAAVVADYPLSPAARESLLALLQHDGDVRPALRGAEKVEFLRSISYSRYLGEHLNVVPEVVRLLRDTIVGLWGVGWDALSALEANNVGMPGFRGVQLPEMEDNFSWDDEPYIFHFPDGNAGVARSLLRQLLPDAVPGNTMEDLVTATVRYDRFDRRNSATRIRLNSTAVDVRHDSSGRRAEVTYVRDGRTERVAGKHVILACYNHMIPHLCPELPAAQKEAMDYAEKVPLVYLSIAVRNWRALAKLGYSAVYIPHSKHMNSFVLDFPVSIGDYRFASTPDDATILHGTWVPTAPDQGLNAREQHLAGKRALFQTSFADFENDIVAKLDGSLAAGGFDAERDIAGITVNRWPHGYAYEYNDLADPAGWGPENGPHVAGRAQIGRISIANSDAAGYAYVNGAIDAAFRAVNEQLRVS